MDDTRNGSEEAHRSGGSTSLPADEQDAFIRYAKARIAHHTRANGEATTREEDEAMSGNNVQARLASLNAEYHRGAAEAFLSAIKFWTGEEP